MIHERVLAAAMEWPWAILPEKLASIKAVLIRRELGQRFNDEEIRAVAGERKISASTVLIDEDGRRFRQHIHRDEDTGQVVSVTTAYEAAAQGGAKGKLICLLPVYGIIGPKASEFEMTSSGGTGIDKLTGQFRQALASSAVKSIVFDFDSPGGSVFGVDEFAAEMFAARGQKKMWAQVNPMCASAAYYLASQCDQIAMTPSGQVGSIGVFTMHADLSKALEEAGVKITHVFAGKYKTEGNQSEPLTEEGLANMQHRVDAYYDAFVDAVARGRGVKSADVRTGFGQGRVVGAQDAKQMGMIDRIATLDETLQRLGGNLAESQPMAAVQTSVTTAEAEQQEVLSMSTVATPAAAAANQATIEAAVRAEKDRCTQLTALASEHNMQSRLDTWLKDGVSVDAARAETLATLKASARPIQTNAGDGTNVQVKIDAEDKTPGSIRVARMMRCMAFAKGDRQLAARRAEQMGDRVVANAFLAATPQNASTITEGGAFVPENFVPDLIEYLRPLAVFRSMRPASYPLVNGNLSLPKLTGGGTATYVGETSPIPVSKAKTGNVKGSAKKLAAIIPISNDLIRFSGLAADTAFRDDMLLAIGQGEDSGFIRCPGSQYSPKGLRYQALAANIVASSIAKAKIDTPDSNISVLTAVQNDVSNMLKRAANQNVRFLRPGWIMSRRTEMFLMYQVRDAMGNLVFKEEMQRGMFMGSPYKATNVIPNNLGAGGIDSEIYWADFADVVIADAPTIAIEVSNEATYVDADGVQHNAFQEDVTLIRFIEEHDLLVRHEESIQVMTGVQYGA